MHNYRCAIPPKLSLEKGMGMTPGYNHRLRLRNMLFSDPVLSRRQLKTPRSCAAYCLRKCRSSQPKTSLLFFQVAFFPFHFGGRKGGKNRLCVLKSLSVLLRSVWLAVRASAAVLRVSVRGRSEPCFAFHPGMLVALRQKRKRAAQGSERRAVGVDV